MTKQQEFVIDFYEGKPGIFIDIGANDGISESNTNILESIYGWTGLCIEPHSGAFQKLKVNRKATAINACISDYTGQSNFLEIDGYAEMLSGIVENYDQRHQSRISNEINKWGGNAKTVSVPTFKLTDLIPDDMFPVSYVSIDTEGSEEAILRGMDLHSQKYKLISIEDNYDNLPGESLLFDAGFNWIAKIAADNFYLFQL